MIVTDKTYVGDDYTVLVLDNGCKLVSTSEELMAGDYVQVRNKDDEEIGYWDHAEWQEDPITVMGAILRCAALGKKP